MFTTTPLSSGSMTGRSMVVRKVPGVSQRTRRPKMISTFSGRPRSRLSAISASKNDRTRHGSSKTTVLETSTCRIEHSHQYPASRSWLPKGMGMRCSHRWANTSMVPGCSRSQIACSPAGSSQDANPFDSSVKAMPALTACRLAHSCPLTQILAG